jgi:hypothetical protein
LMRQRFDIVPANLALFAWASMPSRLVINLALWTAGLALQCALVVVVFRRGVARRFPCFAALICFYPLRSSLLYILVSRVDADVYNPLFSALAVTEILLQAAVAVELMRRINQEMVGGMWRSTRRRSLALLILLGAAGGLTWLVLKITPVSASVDRIQVFAWFVMIALFAVALKKARSANPVRIAAGFAAFSLIQLARLFGRVQAFLKHDAVWYLGWSYTPAIGYLAVVIFWLISLRDDVRVETRIDYVAPR